MMPQPQNYNFGRLLQFFAGVPQNKDSLLLTTCQFCQKYQELLRYYADLRKWSTRLFLADCFIVYC